MLNIRLNIKTYSNYVFYTRLTYMFNNTHVKHTCIETYVEHILDICFTYMELNICLTYVNIFLVYNKYVTENDIKFVRISVKRIYSTGWTGRVWVRSNS